MASKPPRHYQKIKELHPELIGAFEALGEAARASGPLDAKTCALVKLAISLSSGMEGATHSATRKALAAGCAPDEIRHAVFLSTTTIGFPAMMRARAWVDDVIDG